MTTYRFHCTNGLEFYLDTSGQSVPAGESLRSRAEQVAQGLRRRGGDWSDWTVSVHDLDGRQVLLLPVEAALPLAA
ncbi:DUF6894 family protein [Methylobacterium oryzisoli]|uniref:DUF6894 family protein n=1 Tax=Methylobacterium oryzisoli TaxID=3385502 RepID=UPI0038918674